ncbi:hypothetical protein BLNAU_19781 [Blattamonas nauphoetae]|uniref:Uncharacterized protein n=1 Tax=Blattamonas nauphoetae TaxID=2049346 RepID=A0ABQ9X4N5_9EUKA|nr:hypothetical protein BLNAU_19781 [Blattamonas nauphoetae]
MDNPVRIPNQTSSAVRGEEDIFPDLLVNLQDGTTKWIEQHITHNIATCLVSIVGGRHTEEVRRKSFRDVRLNGEGRDVWDEDEATEGETSIAGVGGRRQVGEEEAACVGSEEKRGGQKKEEGDGRTSLAVNIIPPLILGHLTSSDAQFRTEIKLKWSGGIAARKKEKENVRRSQTVGRDRRTTEG